MNPLNAVYSDRKRIRSRAMKSAACLVALMMLISLLTGSASAQTIAAPTYPSKLSIDDYAQQQARREELDEAFLNGLADFSFKASSEVLNAQEKNKNAMFSPLSLYMALAIATQGAKGETQKELVAALGMPSAKLMEEQTSKLFCTLYTDNEVGRLKLANSLWLNNKLSYNKAFLENASKNYYASIFSEDFASKSTAEKISKWVSENTGGKLGKDPTAFETDPRQVMTLINTVYFYDRWIHEFDPKKTRKDTFTLADRKKVKCDFMNATFHSMSYVDGDGFAACAMGFQNDQYMVLILPDKNVSTGAILNNPKRLKEAVNSVRKGNSIIGELELKLVKFKFNTNLDLEEPLKKLGVETAFDPNRADFSPLLNAKPVNPVFISGVKQGSAIALDEKGCEATAFTSITIMPSDGPPPGKAKLVFDRPFLFAIVGRAGEAPLFVGVVNNPAA